MTQSTKHAPHDAAHPTDWRTLTRRLGPAAPWALISATLPGVMGIVLVVRFMDPIGRWLLDQQQMGLAFYITAFAILSGLALLPTWSLAVLGGWVFGMAGGYPAALAGFVGGAAVGYIMGRLTARDRALDIINEHPKWNAVTDTLVHCGFWRTFFIISMLRAPPNSPFALTNLVLAATRTPILPYLLGTLVGMAPRTAAYIVIGTSAEQLTGDSLDKPMWMIVSGIVSTIVVLVIVGVIANRAMKKVTADSSAP